MINDSMINDDTDHDHYHDEDDDDGDHGSDDDDSVDYDDGSIQTTSIQLEIHQSHHRLIASILIMMIKMMVMKYCQANRCLDD